MIERERERHRERERKVSKLQGSTETWRNINIQEKVENLHRKGQEVGEEDTDSDGE